RSARLGSEADKHFHHLRFQARIGAAVGDRIEAGPDRPLPHAEGVGPEPPPRPGGEGYKIIFTRIQPLILVKNFAPLPVLLRTLIKKTHKTRTVRQWLAGIGRTASLTAGPPGSAQYQYKETRYDFQVCNQHVPWVFDLHLHRRRSRFQQELLICKYQW